MNRNGPTEVDESTVAVSLVREPGRKLPALRLLVFAEGRIETHPLPRSGRVVVGRHRDADVRVDHESVSRRHAELSVEVDGLSIRDLASQNGTYVRAKKIAPGEDHPLDPDSVVRVGAVTLAVQAVAAAGSDSSGVDRVPIPAVPGVYVGPWLQRTWPELGRIAVGDIPVLLMGETGVGKEVLVSVLHARSRRAAAPLVVVNCAALPATLLESELFGHERGAFTGASATKTGTIARADGGTLFLDEVGELPLPLQAKLLRVLESGEYRRVGGDKDLFSDVRLVAATNRDLEAAAAAGTFRRDLLFRINAFSLVIPPLRERPEEIDGLLGLFLRRAAEEAKTPCPAVSAEALAVLRRYDWPGNARELRNAVSRAVLLSGGGTITVEHLPAQIVEAEGERALDEDESSPLALRSAVRDAERRRIVEALELCDGNQTKAAKVLGISRRTLISRLDDHGLPRPRKKRGG